MSPFPPARPARPRGRAALAAGLLGAALLATAPLCAAGALVAVPAAAQDTVVVRADNPPSWGGSLALVEEVRIGALEGPPEYAFSYVGAVAPAPDGSVYVADIRPPVVRHYSAGGEYLGDVGREGDGPGEYGSIGALEVEDDGTVVVHDSRNSRIVRFGADGGFLDSTPLRKWLSGFVLGRSGEWWVRTYRGDRPVEGPGTAMWARVTPEGEFVDSVAEPRFPDPVGPNYVLSGRGGYFRPFTVMTLSAFSPHGYPVTTRNDAYALHRPLADGRVLRIEREHEPVPVGPEEREIWEQWSAMFEARDAGTPRERSYPPVPDVKPVSRDLFVDREGRIWLARYAEAVYRPYGEAERADRERRRKEQPLLPDFEWRQPLVWDVIDARGTFLGTVTLPFGTSLAAVRGREVWAITSGEMREDYVVRYRIVER